MRSTIALAALLTLCAVPTPAEAGSAAVECQGKPATIVGTDSAVYGTAGDDVIVMSARDSAVIARGGDDLVCIEDGAVQGGRGEDTVVARGTDRRDSVHVTAVEEVDIRLGPGDDTVTLHRQGAGRGRIITGAGDDLLKVRDARSVYSALGLEILKVDDDAQFYVRLAESVFADAREVTLIGSAARNRLFAVGSACSISMTGGPGSDRLRVVEEIRGQAPGCPARRPMLEGGDGDDVLMGGRADDVLLGGPGQDTANGGKGSDRCVAEHVKGCER